MKKIVLTLVVLMLASPAWATVIITAEVVPPNEDIISYYARTESNQVRSFALDIRLDNDADILKVTGINPDYYIYPVTIQNYYTCGYNCPGQPCGDSDCSGAVNFADLVALKGSWLKCDPDPRYNPCADCNQDGCVNFADLVILKAYWLKAVPTCP